MGEAIFPSSQRRGAKCEPGRAKPQLVVSSAKIRAKLTTPSARNKVASRLLINRASTPPLRGGEYAATRLTKKADSENMASIRHEGFTYRNFGEGTESYEPKSSLQCFIADDGRTHHLCRSPVCPSRDGRCLRFEKADRGEGNRHGLCVEESACPTVFGREG